MISLLFALSTVFSFMFLLTAISICWSLLSLFIYRKQLKSPIPNEDLDWPAVTIQLPVYNEMTVVERVIQAVNNLDYPLDRLEIHILDDSTDSTVQLVDDQMRRLRALGKDIRVLRRPIRVDYKTGALQAAFAEVKGDYIAVFDTDFVPPRDWLKRTVPYFQTNDSLGFVQTRWSFLNQWSSVITINQAVWLNIHFAIEKPLEQRLGLFINYNGSAGIWRKSTIREVGGWPVGTLSEDLYLSYSAQINGWQSVYLSTVEVPSELPTSLYILGLQQERWAAGASQVFRRLGRRILSSKLSLAKKIHALSVLGGYSLYPLWLVYLVISLLALAFLAIPDLCFLPPLLFLFTTLMSGLTAQLLLQKGNWKKINFLQIFLLITLGLSVRISKGTFLGLKEKPIDFIRTPKNGTITRNTNIFNSYSYQKFSWRVENSIELALLICSGVGMILSICQRLWMSLMLMMFFCLSFGFIVIRTFYETWLGKKNITKNILSEIKN